MQLTYQVKKDGTMHYCIIIAENNITMKCMESKQTAVEWYKERLKHRFLNGDTEESIFNQAKAMEKEQIVDAYDNNKMGRVNHGEQYYKETYGK
jgi:hypothetical protein